MSVSKLKKQNAGKVDCWNAIGVWSRSDSKCEKLHEYVHCRNCPVFSEMGRSVFENRAPSQYLRHWRKKIADKSIEEEVKANGVLVFRVNKEWFALPASVLSEIANKRAIHRIPRNLDRYISGVVNINGEIKTCYSFSKLFGIGGVGNENTSIDEKIPSRLIVVTINNLDYVFDVDEVVGLEWYGDADLTPAPATLSTSKLPIILGSFKNNRKHVAVFNIQKLQERLEGSAP